MKSHIVRFSLTAGFVIAALLSISCTEHNCYREHLKVYTNQYLAVCEDGIWHDYELHTICDTTCSKDYYTNSNYPLSPTDQQRLSRVSASCPVLQCIKDDCKCTAPLTRTDIAVMQLEELIDEAALF